MAILKVCNHYLSSNYKKEELKEKFEEELGFFLENFDADTAFNLEFFIEELVESAGDFEIMNELDKDDIDIEYTEEKIDELVENKVSAYQDEEFYNTDFDGDINV